MAIDRDQRADIDAKAPRYGGPHRLLIEMLALDFTGFDDVFSQHLQRCLLTVRHPEFRHATAQVALSPVDPGKRHSQRCRIETPCRPMRLLPEVMRTVVV